MVRDVVVVEDEETWVEPVAEARCLGAILCCR